MSERPMADPVLVPLADKVRIAHFFGTDPSTLIKWHEANGFPILWSGQGRGRKGYINFRQAIKFIQRRTGATP